MKKLFLLCIVLSCMLGNAQTKLGQNLIDSLQPLIATMAEDTNKVIVLGDLSNAYASVNPQNGIRFGNEQLYLSQKLNMPSGIGNAHFNLAKNFIELSNFDSAATHNQNALTFFLNSKDTNSAAGAYSNFGIINLRKGRFSLSLFNFFEACKLYHFINNRLKHAIMLENIGSVYYEQGMFGKAEKYYNIALKTFIRLGTKAEQAHCYGNLANIFYEKNLFDKALINHFSALSINQQLGLKSISQLNLANIGSTYFQINKYDSALKYQFMALKISEELNNKNVKGTLLGNIGETYFAMSKDANYAKNKSANINKAIGYYKESILLCKQIGDLMAIITFSQSLSEIYIQQKKYEEALASYSDYISAKDSVYSLNSKTVIHEIETKYEIDIKNRDITIKNKQIEIASLQIKDHKNKMLLTMVSISVLILLLLIIGIKLQLNELKHKAKIHEISIIQSHDIRGPLARILGLINLFNSNNINDPINRDIIKYIETSAKEIDVEIRSLMKTLSTVTPPTNTK